MTSFNDGIEAAVTTDQARRFLECAVRNWSRASFDRDGLEDFRIELERFRQKVLADALKRPEPSEAERMPWPVINTLEAAGADIPPKAEPSEALVMRVDAALHKIFDAWARDERNVEPGDLGRAALAAAGGEA